MRALRRVRGVVATRRGATQFIVQFLVSFGLVSAVIQFLDLTFSSLIPAPAPAVVITAVTCVLWGAFRALPPRRVQRLFKHPEALVTVAVGDLFEQNTPAVIGFSDTFDTELSPDGVISPESLQGQYLARRYAGSVIRLDADLSAALTNVRVAAIEARQYKPVGKLDRYPIGTVAVLGSGIGRTYALAYSRMSNDLVARASTEDIWVSLGELWATVRGRGELMPLSMGIIGSGLARLGVLDRQSLIKLILLSYVAASRHAAVSRELRIVVAPQDFEAIDMLEIAAFIRAI
jgi:hypothetical protein